MFILIIVLSSYSALDSVQVENFSSRERCEAFGDAMVADINKKYDSRVASSTKVVSWRCGKL